MNLYILNYNNYYNRIVKIKNTVLDYQSYVIYELLNTNFNPNDSVNTQHIIGNGDYDGKGDYLIAVNEYNEIVSRWFIIRADRTRAGQWNLILHRDLVVDYYNIIKESPMYIEKATVSDDDPAIVNNEGVAVNLIKTKEYLLQDDSRCAWIVGYIARNTPQQTIAVTYNDPTADIILDEGQTIKQYINDNKAKKNVETKLEFNFSNRIVGSSNTTYNYYTMKLSNTNNKWSASSTSTTTNFVWSAIGGGSSMTPEDLVETLVLRLNNDTNKSELISQCYMYPGFYVLPNKSKYDSIAKLNGKIVSTYDGLSKYKLSVKTRPIKEIVDINSDIARIDGISSIPTYLKLKMSLKNYGGSVDFVSGTPTFKTTIEDEEISLTYTPVYQDTFNIIIQDEQHRLHLLDAPYDMFCIPFKNSGLDVLITDPVEEEAPFTSISSIGALTAAQSLAEGLGSNLYDLQLLPYCPLTSWYMDNDRFVKSVKTTKESATKIDYFYNSTSKFVMFYSSQSTFKNRELHLFDSISGELLQLPIKSSNRKISNECDMYRLSSPNYNGQFLFSESKLNGIDSISCDCTYLPQSPYIHINPYFKSFYGQDFDDARGLICQGDFSLSYVSSAWTQYQIQNKNYANIFNRGIESLELSQDIQRKQQVFNTITSSISGGIAGAFVGSKGGVTGAAASAVGGALDIKYSDLLRNEAIDYKQDLFNYQLDNIKALPNSLAKVAAYTANNKIFPILEYYTCTDTEKRAIANKIAYNGMTVMRIGTINEFILNEWSYEDIESKNYIKGQLIRLEGIDEDYYILNSIAEELVKGVYLK